MPSDFDSVAAVFRQQGGTMRMTEALTEGINRSTLYAMLDQGLLERLSRGLYRLVELPALQDPDLVTVAGRAPNGVICLISALAHHGLTTQVPHAVDLAIRRGYPAPRIDYPPINVYWFSGAAFAEGIETLKIDGVRVRIYSPEKSVADAFKYRNKIGMDVALEALGEWRQQRKARLQKLLEHARDCRVERVMRPYLEAIL